VVYASDPRVVTVMLSVSIADFEFDQASEIKEEFVVKLVRVRIDPGNS
jgi:hypothetical protein